MRWTGRALGAVVATAVLPLAVVVGMPVGSASALAPSTPAIELLTNGGISAVVTDGDTVYVGGSFTYIGPRTPGIVAIDPVTGAVDTSRFPAILGDIRDVEADGSGGWYVGGRFSSIGGVERTNLAHVLADGRVDPLFQPPAPNGDVMSLALAGGRLYVGAGTSLVGSSLRNGLWAVDPVTGALQAYNPLTSGFVDTMLVDGGTIIAGGFFQSPGGSHLVRIDAATGSFLGGLPSVDSVVSDVHRSGTSLYIGGQFNTVGGQPRLNVAEIDLGTGAVTPWNPGATGGVWRIARSGSNVYMTGQFGVVGGAQRLRIAAVDATTGAATAFDPRVDLTSGNAGGPLAVVGDTVYYSDSFPSVAGQARSYLVALDGTTGAVRAWNPGLNSQATFLGLDTGGALIVGGPFTSAGGVPRESLAAVSMTTGQVQPWAPRVQGGQVEAMVRRGQDIYLGGLFTSVNGSTRQSLAAVGTDGSLRPWGPNANGPVYALADTGETLYAGGEFTSVAGSSRQALVAFDAAGAVKSWGPGSIDGPVKAIAADTTSVLVGGAFTTVSGLPRQAFASLDPAGGAVRPVSLTFGAVARRFGFGTSTSVEDIERTPDGILLGGNFSSVGGVGRGGLALVDDSGTLAPWNAAIVPLADFGNLVDDVAVGDAVYVVGGFSNVSGQSTIGRAAFDLASGAVLPWQPPVSAPRVVVVDGARIVTGGSALTVYTQAQLDPPTNTGAPTIAGTAVVGSTLTCTAGTWTGTAPISYSFVWTREGSAIGGATTSTYVVDAADVDLAIGCEVTASNGAGSDTAVAVEVVVQPSAPVNTAAPLVVGTVEAGETATCLPGTWSGAPAPTYTFEWLRNGAVVAGQVSDTYDVLRTDAGRALSCRVTGTNAAGSAVATSSTVAVPAVAAPANTALPVVTGTPAVGQVLTCSNGTWTGAPAPTFSREWLRAGVAIPGAVFEQYTVSTSDVGLAIRCRVAAENIVALRTATSAAVTIVAPPTNSVAPRITGTVALGQTLTCARGTWTGAPTFAYQWRSNGVALPGATGTTYVVVAADAGASLSCVVTASNVAGSVPLATAPVVVPTAPVFVTQPVLTIQNGTVARLNRRLNCSQGAATSTAAVSYTRQWQRNGQPIAGATAANYTVAAADVGQTITCAVTARAGGFTTTAVTNAVVPTL